MILTFRKKRLLKTVLFLEIDFTHPEKNNYGDLQPGGHYHFNDIEKGTSYEDIKEYLIDTIKIDFKKSIEEIIDIPIIDIKINKVYSGSIELVLTIIFGAFSVVSDYQNFYDNLKLIKKEITRYINNKLKNKYNVDFSIYTDIESPHYNEEDCCSKKDFYPFRFSNRRDSFFIYLYQILY